MDKLETLATTAMLAAAAASPIAAGDLAADAARPQIAQSGGAIGSGEATAQAESQTDPRTLGTVARMDDEELEGATIVSIHGETIGEIERIDTDADGERMAVIGMGGFMGLGETLVKVPLSELHIAEENIFRIRMSVDQLKERAGTKG